MKIRNGFVSNSSSSSFIINSGDIKDIATLMVNVIVNDRTYKTDKKANKILKANLKKALLDKDVLSGKIGITMQTCNYNTYIKFYNDKIYIKTSSNYVWDLDYRNLDVSKYGSEIDAAIDHSYFYDLDSANIRSYGIGIDLDEDVIKCKCGFENYYIVKDLKNRRVCEGCGKEIRDCNNCQHKIVQLMMFGDKEEVRGCKFLKQSKWLAGNCGEHNEKKNKKSS
jgi:hypothetical protein